MNAKPPGAADLSRLRIDRDRPRPRGNGTKILLVLLVGLAAGYSAWKYGLLGSKKISRAPKKRWPHRRFGQILDS